MSVQYFMKEKQATKTYFKTKVGYSLLLEVMDEVQALNL